MCALGHAWCICLIKDPCPCRIGQVDAAAKVALSGTPEGALLEQEASRYHEILALQGSVLPRVLGCGMFPGNKLYGLITAYNPERFDRLRHRHLLPEARQKLQAIHTAGYIHGDLAARNIMLRADGSLCFVDLHLSRPFTPEAAATELQQLDRLFLGHWCFNHKVGIPPLHLLTQNLAPFCDSSLLEKNVSNLVFHPCLTPKRSECYIGLWIFLYSNLDIHPKRFCDQFLSSNFHLSALLTNSLGLSLLLLLSASVPNARLKGLSYSTLKEAEPISCHVTSTTVPSLKLKIALSYDVVMVRFTLYRADSFCEQV